MAKKRPSEPGADVIWPGIISSAQRQESYFFEGEAHRRIAYGEEIGDWDSDHFPCGDCGVVKGQFHVAGCDIEECPKCGKRALGCSCKRDDRKRP